MSPENLESINIKIVFPVPSLLESTSQIESTNLDQETFLSCLPLFYGPAKVPALSKRFLAHSHVLWSHLGTACQGKYI